MAAISLATSIGPWRPEYHCPLGQYEALAPKGSVVGHRCSASSVLAAARRSQHAEPLGNRDRLGNRLDLELLHHRVAVRLDGALRGAEREGDLLVQLAADDEHEDFVLSRG